MATPPFEIRSDPARFIAHEALYLAAREREGRVLEIDQIRALPLPPTAAESREWGMRQDALRRLERYLARTPGRSRILDVGCGSGWMSARLAGHAGRVLAVDVARAELERAVAAFGDSSAITFAFADVFESVFPEAPFDLAVLASSAQYFPDLSRLLERLLGMVRPGREVVILDTPFYDPAQLDEAVERSRRHYSEIGVPAMAARYHHHSWHALDGFAVERIYDPRAVLPRLGRRLLRRRWSPFPVLAVRQRGRG